MKPKYLAPGSILMDNYEIINKIKTGGMGSVYRVKNLLTGGTCALKELINLSIDEAEHKDAIMRFEREASILSNLKHPSLPGVIDYFSGDDKYYLIMEFVEGKDLSAILKERGNPGLPEEDVVEWTLQICDVLTYLHSRDPVVIYRDIKPSNIMVRERDNKVTLIDFGIARTLQKGTDISHTKTTIGTIGYMSPEQYRGKPVPQSDIYSLGVTMYHLLSGNKPIPFNVIALVKEDKEISEKINSIVMSCVQIKSGERFKSAGDVKKALMGLLEVDVPVKPKRGLKSVRTTRKAEDPYEGLEADKILTMAKGAKDKKIITYLIDILLSDPKETHRRAAANALGCMGDEKAIESLMVALGDFDDYVRTNAAWALGELGNSYTAEILFQLYCSHEDKNFRNSLKKAIIKITHRRQKGEVAGFLLQFIEKEIAGEKNYLSDIPFYFSSCKDLLIEFIRDAERFEVRFQIGLLYYHSDRFADAMVHFEKAHKFKKEDHRVLFFIGKNHQKRREFKDAVKAYEEALKLSLLKTRVMDRNSTQLEDTIIDLYNELARENIEKGSPGEELECYNKIIDALPEYIETSFFRGLLAMKQNNISEAIKFFTQYIEENPQGKRAIEVSELMEKIRPTFFSKIKGIFWKS